jgi:hypothetical protein
MAWLPLHSIRIQHLILMIKRNSSFLYSRCSVDLENAFWHNEQYKIIHCRYDGKIAGTGCSVAGRSFVPMAAHLSVCRFNHYDQATSLASERDIRLLE